MQAVVDRSAGIPIVHTFGDPYARGRQHGEVLRDEIHACFREVWRDGWFRISPRLAPLLFRRWAAMQARFLHADEHAELRGLADGSRLPLDDVRVMNTAPPFEAVHNLISGGSSDACTQIATRGPQGVVLGRNLDAVDVGRLFRYFVMLVNHPDAGPAWVTPGVAGKVLDAMTGWNEAGLVVAQNVSELAFERFHGVYTGAMVRRVVAQSTSLDEAAACVGAAPPLCGGGRSLLVARGDDAAVLELAQRVFGASHVARRSWGECGDAPDTIVLTNHYRTPERVSAAPGRSSWARLSRAMAMARQGIDTVEAMQAAMTDCCDVAREGVEEASETTVCCVGEPVRRFGPLAVPDDLEVRVATRLSTVCDLRRRHMWVAVGQPWVRDATQYRCFDVEALLKDSSRPRPPSSKRGRKASECGGETPPPTG